METVLIDLRRWGHTHHLYHGQFTDTTQVYGAPCTQEDSSAGRGFNICFINMISGYHAEALGVAGCSVGVGLWPFLLFAGASAWRNWLASVNDLMR